MVLDTFPELKEVVSQRSYEDVRSLIFLHHLVREVKPQVVLELGTGLGCSTAFMALAIGDGKVFSVDGYSQPTSNPHLVVDNMKRCGVSDKVVLIVGHTFNAGRLLNGEAPDVVFMDASHAEVGLRQEYDSIRSALPEEHIIIVDDTYTGDAAAFVAYLVCTNYDFCVLLPYHFGMAVLIKGDERLLGHVIRSIKATS